MRCDPDRKGVTDRTQREVRRREPFEARGCTTAQCMGGIIQARTEHRVAIRWGSSKAVVRYKQADTYFVIVLSSEYDYIGNEGSIMRESNAKEVSPKRPRIK